MMTLDEIKQFTTIEAVPPEDRGSCDWTRPWWIVLVNPRRQPPSPKFHTGHESPSQAEKICGELQAAADQQAERERIMQLRASYEPVRYFVLEKPDDATCAREFGFTRPVQE